MEEGEEVFGVEEAGKIKGETEDVFSSSFPTTASFLVFALSSLDPPILRRPSPHPLSPWLPTPAHCCLV